MFKVSNNIAAAIIDDLFPRFYLSYNLRSKSICFVPGEGTVKFYAVLWPSYLEHDNELNKRN